ncbi:allophanate hydrolase [Aeromicrobium sp. PE09-221]|uniref:5-oxoprolinase subunit C family protein n=1 Tax=Aeromicrobium sp. PE09-221 TaxID=1898043 RepID=UPI000B3E9D33|nr:biotin-dependent carboxyltransferase family protein [Aeromicrobium sp. PE09-221]OUZ09287.1 allophanate hydrolase [Aeromicrobium sp. PE09-221]
MTTIEILATGPQATLQDLGRPGYASIGVGRSGAADRRSFALAHRLVGNPEDAVAIEVLMGGLSLSTDGTVDIAVTGADVEVHVDRGQGPVPMGLNARHTLQPGWTLSLGQATSGVRAYVALRGGIEAEPVLGSCSTDTLSGLGPAPLAGGDRLALGSKAGELPTTDLAPVARFDEDVVTLRAVRGPHDDWLADADRLTGITWTVSDRTNRVGARLCPPEGDALQHAEPGRQLPSEGATRGAIQVPPNGEPVLFLADHPVTGGYPVAAVLLDEDVDRAAQSRPGQQVRLTWS